MPDPQTVSANSAQALRAKLLENYVTILETAVAMDRSPRTISRWAKQGKLVTVTIGRTPYVDVLRSREALVAPPASARPPGRPARKAA